MVRPVELVEVDCIDVHRHGVAEVTVTWLFRDVDLAGVEELARPEQPVLAVGVPALRVGHRVAVGLAVGESHGTDVELITGVVFHPVVGSVWVDMLGPHRGCEDARLPTGIGGPARRQSVDRVRLVHDVERPAHPQADAVPPGLVPRAWLSCSVTRRRVSQCAAARTPRHAAPAGP